MAELNGDERIHIVGAGGAGMSALAKLLWSRGHRVTGSDARWGPALATLADLGLDVWAGHRPEAIDGADLVVASSAVPDSDIEITSAVARGIDVWRRPDLLDAITAGIPTLGATGTHGKTSRSGRQVSTPRSCWAASWSSSGPTPLSGPTRSSCSRPTRRSGHSSASTSRD
jgi:UDP-N-acetylmuramate--alanine ligase